MKLTRPLFALAGLALATAPLAAQDLLVGIRSELTFPRLPGATSFNSRPGYTFGPQFAVPLNKFVAIQTELLYTQYGAGVSVASGAQTFVPGGFGGGALGQTAYVGSFTPASSAQYIQLPVMARLTLGQVGPVRPVFYAGPMASFMFSCRSGFDPSTGDGLGCGGNGATGMPMSQFTGMSRFDVGGVAGAGLQANLFDVIVIGSEVRYQRGLRAVSPLYPDFRNQSVSLAFRLGAGPKLLSHQSGGYGGDMPESAPLRSASGGTRQKSSAGTAPGVKM
ncbi:MAG TPA: porin family protein [Gemmatimonadales bacterium]